MKKYVYFICCIVGNKFMPTSVITTSVMLPKEITTMNQLDNIAKKIKLSNNVEDCVIVNYKLLRIEE